MTLSCHDGKHVALPQPIRNQGFDFGRCRRCGRDMVRSRRAWRAVPDGFQVVWRRDPPGKVETSAAQLKLNLEEHGLSPASPVPFERGRRRLATAAELLVLGLRGLASAMAERARLWLRTRPARRIAIAGALGPPVR